MYERQKDGGKNQGDKRPREGETIVRGKTQRMTKIETRCRDNMRPRD